MIDRVSIRQRLYLEQAQQPVLVEHCHHARFMFNIGLEQRSMWARSKHDRGTHPDYGDLNTARVNASTQMRELAQLRTDLDWLKAGSSSVQQAALRDLDRAFANFYAGRAKHPTFKRSNPREGSFVVRDLTVARLNRKWATVNIPKVGPVRFRLSRSWAEVTAATSARVTHRNGRWHVSFTTPPVGVITAETGAIVGIDRGVANTLAASDGTMVQAPSLSGTEQARYLSLQRRLSRQKKGSNRRAATLDRLAVMRRRLDDRRTNWVEQTTTELAATYDLIAVEDLRITNLVRRPAPRPDPDRPGVFLPNQARAKAGLNRAILASCWGAFLTRLDQKMPTGHLIRVDPRNTSRICAACGHCAAENRESQAVFCCEACEHTAHADTNAAINILDRALTSNAAGHAVSGRISPATASSVNQPAA